MAYKKVRVKKFLRRSIKIDKKCSNCKRCWNIEHLLPNKKIILKRRCERWRHLRSNPKHVLDSEYEGDYLYLRNLKPCKYWKWDKVSR